eukprot:jgi/Undpi1/1803/HiC_scaffold_12.g05190.m1
MTRSGWTGVLGIFVMINHVLGHWNSEVTLSRRRRLQEEESVNAKWQCEPQSEKQELSENLNAYHLRGVNLGSWMVLEPWITPSMFFQFLGKGNKQLKRHWSSWVTEGDIAQLATIGVNTIRLPVGDWMYKPYGPYVGCTDGALDEVDRLFDLCRRYGMRVLLDIHAIVGSQNGFDNSGQAMDVEWTTYSGNAVSGTATFVHWPYRAARWMGEFNRDTGTYNSKNHSAIAHTLQVVQTMVDLYSNETAVMGLQPVNEPWQFTPLEWLKDFYWDSYHIVREQAPHWLFLMHDSFHFDVGIWGDFMKNCPTVGLDTHIYQAWNTPGAQASYLASACDAKKQIQAMEEAGMPVIVGEWSLATDNCAMWLNGFQDNLPGFPQVQCEYVRCPLPYMGGEQPGAPVNPNNPPLGPFGTGSSTPSFGMCPIDSRWHAEDEFMTGLAYAKLHAFEAGHGWFFWNFKTELEVRWNYLEATDKGYFPYHVDNLEQNEDIVDACNQFNGRNPVKGMPPGIYSEDEDTGHSGLKSVGAVLLVGVASFMVFTAFKSAKNWGGFRRGWHAVTDAEASSINQGEFSPPTMGRGYQEARAET